MMSTPNLQFTHIDIPTYQIHRQNKVAHLLLDVREPEEYVMGHIPGAVNIPLSEVEDRIDEIPQDEIVVVVCAHGIRSIIGARMLVASGYNGVYNLSGGTAEWQQLGLELVG